jgi:hypothetical protein
MMPALLAWALLIALDGGVPVRDAGVAAPAADDDDEVIRELELLEQLDGLADLELLETLDLAR